MLLSLTKRGIIILFFLSSTSEAFSFVLEEIIYFVDADSSIRKNKIEALGLKVNIGSLLMPELDKLNNELNQSFSTVISPESLINLEYSVNIETENETILSIIIGDSDGPDTQISNQNPIINFETFYFGLGLGKEIPLSKNISTTPRVSFFRNRTTLEIYEVTPSSSITQIYSNSNSISLTHDSNQVNANIDLLYQFKLKSGYFLSIGWFFDTKYSFKENDFWTVRGTLQKLQFSNPSKYILGTGTVFSLRF